MPRLDSSCRSRKSAFGLATLGLLGVGFSGCATSAHLALSSPGMMDVTPALSPEADVTAEAKAIASFVSRQTKPNAKPVTPESQSASVAASQAAPSAESATVKPVGHVVPATADHGLPALLESEQSAEEGMLTINGRQYRLQLVEPTAGALSIERRPGQLAGYRSNQNSVSNTAPSEVSQSELVPWTTEDRSSVVTPSHPTPEPLVSDMPLMMDMNGQLMASELPIENQIELNLPSALAMIDGQHPAVGLAQWRVQEAYAKLANAKVLWLPSIQAGFSFHRHDGNYQASNGDIVDVNRNSFQYGLGTAATGAGTTQRPGLLAQFHLADAIFMPEIAKKTAWARKHSASATLNEQLLKVSLAYIDLLRAHQDSELFEVSQTQMAEVLKLTDDFAQAGEGLKSDTDLVQTQINLNSSRTIAAREAISTASARLSRELSMDGREEIRPLDVVAVPLELTSGINEKSMLIRSGLASRPELKESQALVAAACDAYRKEKYAPLVPSVLLGYSTSGFGGGLGNELDNVDGRYDLDAVVSWEIRHLGFGERAARRASSAKMQQAKYEKLRLMDQIAAEIAEAAGQVEFRRQRISVTEKAISAAERSHGAILDRVRDGEGSPIELLQAVEAVLQARRAYLDAVIQHNRSQFQLQWALGWPVNSGDVASNM